MSDSSAAPDVRKLYGTYGLLVLTSVFWGSAFVFSKVAETSVPPLAAAFLRFGLGSIVGLIMILVRKLRNADYDISPSKTWFDTAVLGIVGVAGYNLLFFEGLALSQAPDGSMIIPTLTPAITVILAAVFLKERFRRKQVAGLGITLVGSMIFFSAIVFSHVAGGQHRIIGDLMFLGSAVLWAFATLLSKRLTSRMDPFLVSTYTMVVGSFILGLIAMPQLVQIDWSSLGWPFWSDLVYLAVFPSVLANWFFYVGVQRIGPSRAAVFMYLVPVSSLILAAAVLGETLTLGQFSGAALMIAGVWLINRKNRSVIRGALSSVHDLE
ncbi:MAG: DMT family transporter [Bacilli bacterium]